MIGYRFLSPAEEEMSEAAAYYDAASSGLGSDFLADVQLALDRLREYPEAGMVVTERIRRMLLHRFPFSILYAVEAELIIIAVAHHGRRPNYWESRTDP